MSDSSEVEHARLVLEQNRSAVRAWVTYGAVFAYLLLAAIVTIWLKWAGRYEVAIGVLGLGRSCRHGWLQSRNLVRGTSAETTAGWVRIASSLSAN